MANPEQITEHMVNDFISLCTEKGYQIRKQIGEGSFGKTYLGIRREGTGSGAEEAYAIKLALDNAMLHAVKNSHTLFFFPPHLIYIDAIFSPSIWREKRRFKRRLTTRTSSRCLMFL